MRCLASFWALWGFRRAGADLQRAIRTSYSRIVYDGTRSVKERRTSAIQQNLESYHGHMANLKTSYGHICSVGAGERGSWVQGGLAKPLEVGLVERCRWVRGREGGDPLKSPLAYIASHGDAGRLRNTREKASSKE